MERMSFASLAIRGRSVWWSLIAPTAEGMNRRHLTASVEERLMGSLFSFTSRRSVTLGPY
jgi:hypothetical protein